MFPRDCAPTRRQFFMTAAAVTTAASGLTLVSTPAMSEESDINIIGPKKGYSPLIGTLVSEMIWMRHAVLNSVKGMSQKDLDFLFDANSNTIGSLLMHLAATDRIYQLNTFEGNDLKVLPASFKDMWGVAMDLGEPARKTIKGHDLDYYLNLLSETREHTFAEFRKGDDDWFLTVDKAWGWNNHCKWFHVCEHESNHNGQIKFLKKRIPGAKQDSE